MSSEWLKVARLARPLERLDDLPDVLRPGSWNDEQGVFGVDDDQVLDTDRGNEPAVTKDKAAGGIDEDRLAVDGVAVRVGMNPVAQLSPVADVRPVERSWDEQQPVSLFHDAAIDDLDRKPCVQLRRGLLVARR